MLFLLPQMKADQCHLSEAEYLRELIMNSQQVEAPPRQFYEQMEKVNRIASTIQRICATAQDKEALVKENESRKIKELFETMMLKNEGENSKTTDPLAARSHHTGKKRSRFI